MLRVAAKGTFYLHSSGAFVQLTRIFSVLPDVCILLLVVAFVRQIFALKYRHKVTWQLVSVGKRRETIWIGYRDGLVIDIRLINVRQWLVFVAVVARLHLWLLNRLVVVVVVRTCFVDETGLHSWALL